MKGLLSFQTEFIHVGRGKDRDENSSYLKARGTTRFALPHSSVILGRKKIHIRHCEANIGGCRGHQLKNESEGCRKRSPKKKSYFLGTDI